MNASTNANNYINIQFNTHTYKLKSNLHISQAQWQQHIHTSTHFIYCLLYFTTRFCFCSQVRGQGYHILKQLKNVIQEMGGKIVTIEKTKKKIFE